MELALAVFNVGAGLGLLAVGLAVMYLAWRLTPLIRETRSLTADVRRLTRATQTELRPLLDRAEEATRAVEILAEDAAIRVARLDDLMASLEQRTERPSAAAPVGSVESVQTPEEWPDR